MPLTNVSAGAPQAGWRSWYLVLEGGSPRLMGFGSHTLGPLVPGQAPLPPAGQAGLPPTLGSYGGYVFHAGVNEVFAPANEKWPWESAFYAVASHSDHDLKPKQHGRACGAYGRVETWGWTADYGSYREAQFLRVLEIFVAPFHAERVDALAAHYGVPVSIG